MMFVGALSKSFDKNPISYYPSILTMQSRSCHGNACCLSEQCPNTMTNFTNLQNVMRQCEENACSVIQETVDDPELASILEARISHLIVQVPLTRDAAYSHFNCRHI